MLARLGLTALLFASGCFNAGAVVRARHAAEFHCSASEIIVEDIGSGTIRARGCGVEAMYVCARRGSRGTPGICMRNSDATPSGERPAHTPRNPQARPASHLGIQRGNIEGRPALRVVLDDAREPVEVVASSDALLLRIPNECEQASLVTTPQDALELERVLPRVFRVPLEALAGRVDGSRSLILRACDHVRPFSALERHTLRQLLQLAPRLATQVSASGTSDDAQAAGGAAGAADLRAALDARRDAILACVERPSVAVRLRWDAQGTVTLSLGGSLAGSAEEECVRVAAGTLTAGATAPGELLHPVSR